MNFFENKPIFGMIHLSPGSSSDPNRSMRAIQEIKILESEGVDGFIIENYHGSSSDVLEALTDLGSSKIKIGVNILPNDFERAFRLVDFFQGDFIQLDHIAGSYKKCQEFDVDKFMRFRKTYPNIKVLGGVWPKYYYPITGSILENDIKDAMKRCDAIVVTGSGTGEETPLDKIKQFRNICGDFPLIVGAGLDDTNVTTQLEHADGGIVGSCFKMGKRTTSMINRELVTEFMDRKLNHIS